MYTDLSRPLHQLLNRFSESPDHKELTLTLKKLNTHSNNKADTLFTVEVVSLNHRLCSKQTSTLSETLETVHLYLSDVIPDEPITEFVEDFGGLL